MSTITLATIGATGVTRRLVANGVDKLTFTLPGATALTSADAATQGAFVTATYPDISFYGRVARVSRNGSGASESQTVELHGLWASLQQITYLQSWTVWDTSSSEAIAGTRPRVILGQNAAGERVTSGAQISDAIAWAASMGLPIALGTVDAGISLPFDEQENLSCADVILAMLRILPDYVAWFEGNTFHCRRRANLAGVSLPLSALSSLTHSARHDLQVPGVVINYEVTHNDDGRARTSVITDTAGNASHWAAARLLYDLQGRSRSFSKADIETQDIPADLTTDKAFLKQLHPWLATVDDADLAITAASRGVAEPLPRMLVKGPIPDWLNKDSDDEQLTWVIDYTVKVGDPAVVVETISGLTLTANIVATDALTRNYSRLASLDTGEEVPTGIAAALFTAWGTLWHEGRVTLTEAECPGTYRPGQLLTVNSISSPIQEVIEDLDSGSTTLSFGPPANIQADTLIALFRGLRARRFSYSRGERQTSEPDEDGDFQSGRAPDTRPTSGAGQTKRLRLLHTGDPSHEIDLNPADIDFLETSPEPLVLKTREILTLITDGGVLKAQRVQALCSLPYGDTIDLVAASKLLPAPGDPGDVLALNAESEPVWETPEGCPEEEV